MDIENGGDKIMNRSKIYISLVVLVFASPIMMSIITTNNYEWTSVPVYGGGAIMSVAVDPSSPNIIYAASDLSGPYKSTDFGNGWTSIRTGLKSEGDWDASAIAINPKNHNQIYLGSGQAYGKYNGDYGGLFRSNDGGNTWDLISRKLKFSGHGDVRQTGDGLILFDKNNNSIMYGATIFDGIFKSIDNGNNWSYKALSGLCLTGMAMNNNGTIFVSALSRGSNSGGIYKSQDGGDTWITLSSLSTKKLVVNGNTIYAAVPGVGIYKSIDGGTSWIVKNNGISASSINSLSGLVMDQSNPNILYTVSNTWTNQLQSLYKTTNGGDSWINVPAGKPYVTVNKLWTSSGSWFSSGSYSLTIDPTNSNRIYLADSYTVWKSNDGGTTWSTNAQGLETTVTDVIKSHPLIPGLVIIGSRDVTGVISKDGGTTTRSLWDWRTGNISDSNIWGVDYVNKDVNILNATIYVSTGNDILNIGNLWKSSDGGSTWHTLPNLPSPGQKKALAIDQKNPNIIYISANNNNIYKSTDYGNSWRHLTNGLPSSNSDFKKIVIDPTNTNILYALDTKNGVYKSTDGGSSWLQSNKGFSSDLGTNNNFNCLAIDPNHTNILYGGGQYAGLYKSIDSAGNWKTVLTNFSCGAVFVSPINSAVYAGGMAEWWFNSQTGLYASYNEGNNWSSIGDLVNNIPLPYIKSIEEDPFSPGTLYIGTEGGGNYRYGFLGAYPNNIIVPIPIPVKSSNNDSTSNNETIKD